jgi:hypothetical protein
MSTVEKVDRALRGLPLDEKIGALIVHLCQQNVDGIMAIQRLIATTKILGQNLADEVDRRCCAGVLRDCAADVEAEHVPLVRE